MEKHKVVELIDPDRATELKRIMYAIINLLTEQNQLSTAEILVILETLRSTYHEMHNISDVNIGEIAFPKDAC